MISDCRTKQVTDLFSIEHPSTYSVPAFQRPYVWRVDRWEGFFDDIEDTGQGHFLGAMICINIQQDSTLPSEFSIIDGQQRLTTLSLLILAIYSKLSEMIDDHYRLMTLKKRIINDDGNLRLRLGTTENRNDYKYLAFDLVTDQPVTKPAYFGNRRIAQAYGYFCKRISELDDADMEQFLTNLLSAVIVKIDVACYSDAFKLFETLNNTGTPLSSVDLIKSKLLGGLQSAQNVNHDLEECNQRWQSMMAQISDEPAIHERYLRHFYNAFHLEQGIGLHGYSRATKSNLIAVYEKLIERNASDIFDRLEQGAMIYSRSLNYAQENMSHELKESMKGLDLIRGNDAYMLLLFIDKKFDIQEQQKARVVRLLCKYFLRRSVTNFPPTRALTDYFMNVIKRLNQISEWSYDSFLGFICEEAHPASDDDFERGLRGDLYQNNTRVTRYILASIENSLSDTAELNRDFYLKHNGSWVWTVEHIFPQGTNIPHHWVEMIGDGDLDRAREAQLGSVHKLGNLTLTGYNSALATRSFEEKRDAMGGSAGNNSYIGFRNGLHLNRALCEKDSWKEQDIDERTEALVQIALQIFSMDIQ